MTDHPTESPEPSRPAGSLAASAAVEAASELPGKAADVVQLVVDTLHDKAVRPVVLAARVVVFGLVVAALAALLVVVGSIAVLRLFDVYVFGHQVWLSYIVLGGALTLAGFGAWSRRTARPPAAASD